MSRVLSAVVVSSVGLISKAFLYSGLCSLQVNGLHHLEDALNRPERAAGQGVVTVCNHISTLDDPVIWGVLPTRYYLSTKTTRWVLGASEIMFTNPVLSAFFSLGQTLETFRGKGIYQDAVDVAIQKINQGGWIHLYGEGKVNQPCKYPLDKLGQARLPRFKWGIGRILMEAKTQPVVIPMWLTGFQKLMPLDRPFPYNYFPRPGAHLTITFGEAISGEDISQTLKNCHRDSLNADHDHISEVRRNVTSVLHRGVESLGRSVSGPLLGGVAREP